MGRCWDVVVESEGDVAGAVMYVGKIKDLTIVRGTASNDAVYEGGRSLTGDDS
jgi:hypothetical protein